MSKFAASVCSTMKLRVFLKVLNFASFSGQILNEPFQRTAQTLFPSLRMEMRRLPIARTRVRAQMGMSVLMSKRQAQGTTL